MMRQSAKFSWALVCGIIALLTACGVGVPDKNIPGASDFKSDIVHEPEWSKVPALQRIPVSSDLFLAHSVRPPMPADIANRKISLRFAREDATLRDLINILDYQDLSLVLRSSGDTGLSEDDLGDIVLPFRRYDGTVAGLAKKLANSLDLAVWWENDSLYVSDRDRYVISVPQNQQVIDNVIKELEDFGAEDVTPSMYGGRIVYSVRPAVNNELIKPYLNGLAGNLAEITLQLAVVELNLTDGSERGIDWSSFQIQFGNPAKALAAGTSTILNNTGVNATISGTSSTDIGSRTLSAGAGGSIGGTGVTDLGSKNLLGVSGAILYLSQYGKTTTQEMVELRTLAGMKVQLQSLHSTPYIKGISSTSSTQSNSNNVTSSLDTSTIDTGLAMAFTPYYDSVLGLVSVNVNIQISSLVALRNLTFGDNTGTTGTGTTGTGTTGTGTTGTGTTGTGTSNTGSTAQSITQPETQKNQITDIVRIPAGEVVILGGLKEATTAQTRTAPLDLYDSVGSKSDSNTTTLVFFIMRPVVTIFDPHGAKVNTTLPGDPSDLSDRAYHDDTEANPVTQIEPDALPPLRRNDDKAEPAPAPQTKMLPPDPKPPLRKLATKTVVETDDDVIMATPPPAKSQAAPTVITQIENSAWTDNNSTPPPAAKARGEP